MASQSPGGFKGKKAKRSARDKRLGKYAPRQRVRTERNKAARAAA